MSVWLACVSMYLISVWFHLTVGCPGTGVIDGVSYKYVLGPLEESKYSYPMSYLSRWWCTPLPKTISPQHFHTSSFKTGFLYNPGFSGT